MKPTTARIASVSAAPYAVPVDHCQESRRKGTSRSMSAVHLAEHDVDRADDGDRVGEHGAGQDRLEDREIAEGRRADAAAVAVRSALGDEVVAELAARVLDAEVALARLALEGEVAHVLRHDLAALRHLVDRLAQDANALAHLEDAHPVAVPAVADRALQPGADRDVELEAVVEQVGRVAAQVEAQARSAQVRSGEPVA